MSSPFSSFSRSTRSLFFLLRRNVHSNAKSWQVRVTPGGTLKARIPLTCTIHVKSLDPQQSDWTLGRIDVDEQLKCADTEVAAEEVDMMIKTEADDLQIFSRKEQQQHELINNKNESDFDTDVKMKPNMHLYLYLPGRYNFDMILEDAHVIFYDKVEGDILLNLNNGRVESRNKLKSMNVNINIGNKAHVKMNNIQGNLKIESNSNDQENNIDITKIQGPLIQLLCKTNNTIKIQTMYSNDIRIDSNGSNLIELGSIQSDQTTINSKQCERIKIDSIEGNLNVMNHKGNIETNLTNPKHIILTSNKGNINLGLPDDSNDIHAKLHIQCNNKIDNDDLEYNPDDDTYHMGQWNNDDHNASIHLLAKDGDVSISKKSWADTFFSSLKQRTSE